MVTQCIYNVYQMWYSKCSYVSAELSYQVCAAYESTVLFGDPRTYGPALSQQNSHTDTNLGRLIQTLRHGQSYSILQ